MNIEQIYEKIKAKVEAECSRNKGIIPYIPSNGRYTDAKSIYWWTNGFWAGILWQMYHAERNPIYVEEARKIEKRLDDALSGFEHIDHDTGFLWLHTAGADYRLTGNEHSKRRLHHAATVLAGRFNPLLGIIRAWDDQWIEGYDTAGAAIIDTMMNLPLLYLATEITGDKRFKVIAKIHAETMLRDMVRRDGSVNHQIVYDTETGRLIANPAGQGYKSGSSWSRGQSWGIYGFALSYRYTHDERFLNAAKRIVAYFMANVSLTGYIPYCDFRAPEEPIYYDTTAGMAAACGMLEIAGFVNEYEKPFYINSAKRLVEAADEKWCDYDIDNDGILDGGSVSYHNDRHHEKIIYGDYFLIEAVLRLLNKDFLIW